MSFKRDGDDRGWLDNLKRRRVNELLVEDIPEEEATLMKNGRYCCLVCYHRPIFDTVNMLAIHRQGKKHASHFDRYKADRDDLEREKLRRLHEGTLKGFTLPTQHSKQLSKDGHSLLQASAYNPKVKHKKSAAYDRKAVIDFTPEHTPRSTETTPRSSLPGNNEDFQVNDVPQTISEYREKKRMEMKLKEPIEVKPYVKKSNKYFQNLVAVTAAYKNEKVLGKNSNLHPPLDHAHSSTSVNPAVVQSQTRSEFSAKEPKISMMIKKKAAPKSSIAHLSTTVKPAVVQPQPRSGFLAQPKSGLIKGKAVAEPLPATSNGDKLTTQGGSSTEKSAENRRIQAEKYLTAIGSGWKKDRAGNWIKDENAEFDSDEEPPDF